jgi:hypothetical protein
MSGIFLSESVKNKWKPVVEHTALPEIKDAYKKTVTTVLLENQQRALNETAQTTSGTQLGSVQGSGTFGSSGGIDAFDPVLISLVRRAMPNLMAYDIAGVQPMTGPTGLIFAMRTKYTGNRATGSEAFYNEANSGFSGTSNGGTSTASGTMADIFANDVASTQAGVFDPGRPTSTSNIETAFGQTHANMDAGTGGFAEMSFSIEKTSVVAKSRALKAEYTTELAQDLKAVHGLDAETELANILSTEIMFEINRELVRTIYDVAQLGCQQTDLDAVANTANRFRTGLAGGIYDLEKDSDGRWSAEKFRGLTFQIERECNEIARITRRGKGNFIVCSPDVASALSMSGLLDFSAVFNPSMNVDVTGNTLVGALHGGRVKVYVDPYSAASTNFVCVGYKGTSPYDAGVFYCPYVPLQMVRAVDTVTFQPKIGFKTRYGMVSNPYVTKSINSDGTPVLSSGNDGETLTRRVNPYYRIFKVANIHGNDSSYGGT